MLHDSKNNFLVIKPYQNDLKTGACGELTVPYKNCTKAVFL